MKIFEKFIPLLLPTNQVKKENKVNLEKIDEIICFSNTAIGDTLFNTPIFRNIKKYYPQKKLTVVLNPKNYTLFETNPYIDEVMLYCGKTKHFFQFLIKLKRKKPKLILLLHSNEPQATPLAILSGAEYVFKLPNITNSFNKWHSNYPMDFNYSSHAITNRLNFLDFLKISYDKCEKMDLFLKDNCVEYINKFFKEKNIKKAIGFQIGASTKSRMWFKERWIELGKLILETYKDYYIILTGTKNERHLTAKVENELNNKRVLNVAGDFSLMQASALIGKLDLIITPDTGPLHIATALKTPTIGLFVVADAKNTNPCYDKEIHLYIQKQKTCTPCIAKRCKFQECMLQITSNEVFKKVKILL